MSIATQRKNLEEAITVAVARMVEEGLQESAAFERVAADWLGYPSLPDERFPSGANDKGIDFWVGSEASLDFHGAETG